MLTSPQVSFHQLELFTSKSNYLAYCYLCCLISSHISFLSPFPSHIKPEQIYPLPWLLVSFNHVNVSLCFCCCFWIYSLNILVSVGFIKICRLSVLVFSYFTHLQNVNPNALTMCNCLQNFLLLGIWTKSNISSVPSLPHIDYLCRYYDLCIISNIFFIYNYLFSFKRAQFSSFYPLLFFFHVYVISVWFQYQGNAGLVKLSQKVFPPLLCLEMKIAIKSSLNVL